MNANFRSESTVTDMQSVVDLTSNLLDPVSGRPLTECRLAPALPAKSVTTGGTEPKLVKLNEPVRQEDVEADPVWKLRGILDRVNNLAHLGPNWDSYGSEPPTAEARSKATDLIWDVVRESFGRADLTAIPFAVAPLSGGGVQLEWRRGNNSIEVEVDPLGNNFGYLLSRQNQGNREFDERDNVQESDAARQVIAALS